MRGSTVWAGLLGIEHATVERVEYDDRPADPQTPAAIDASLEHGLSNALIERTSTKIRLLTRIVFGFKSPQALVALAMLSLGGHRPSLPGRTAHG